MTFIDYINRYTTVTSSHEAAFDEYLVDTDYLPADGPLKLTTKVETFLKQRFREAEPPSVILTGNAGDGKTYLCRKLIEEFSAKEFTHWPAEGFYDLERDGTRLHIVKDLSELSESEGVKVIEQLARIETRPGEAFLVAANEGRLRKLLSEAKASKSLSVAVKAQLEGGPSPESKLVLLDLNRVATSTFVPPVLDYLTSPANWADVTCPVPEICPIHHNVKALRQPRVQMQAQLLYRTLEQTGVHFTIRDMLTHLAFTLTAGHTCSAHTDAKLISEPHTYTYFENFFGITALADARHKMSALRHLARFDVGSYSLYKLDNFIINGQEIEPEPYNQYLGEEMLASKRFRQNRDTYLKGNVGLTKEAQTPTFLNWLPYCRRKLFFEHHDAHLTARLLPFLYHTQYFELLEADDFEREAARDALILGLNRAFTGLYLKESDQLYLTEQYAASLESQVPLVNFSLPASDLVLGSRSGEDIYDGSDPVLTLTAYPPRTKAADKKVWELDLLSFEYLMRRGAGSTPNILDRECELKLRLFKDQLIRNFKPEGLPQDRLEFFVGNGSGYDLKKLSVDEDGRLRSIG